MAILFLFGCGFSWFWRMTLWRARWPCTCRYAELVQMLLSAKCNVHASGQNKWTPLHVACREGSAAVAIMLIDAGADVNAQTEHADSPLSLVLEHKRGKWEQVEKLLRERGAR